MDATTQALQELVRHHAAPGIAYVVVDAHEQRFAGAAGVMDSSDRRPVTPDTLFMAASTTKALTAIVVMRLVDGEFPDYNRVIPKNNDLNALVAQDAFSRAANPLGEVSDPRAGSLLQLTRLFREAQLQHLPRVLQ